MTPDSETLSTALHVQVDDRSKTLRWAWAPVSAADKGCIAAGLDRFLTARGTPQPAEGLLKTVRQLIESSTRTCPWPRSRAGRRPADRHGRDPHDDLSFDWAGDRRGGVTPMAAVPAVMAFAVSLPAVRAPIKAFRDWTRTATDAERTLRAVRRQAAHLYLRRVGSHGQLVRG